MKKVLLYIIISSVFSLAFAQKLKQAFVSTDIDNFWMAYDKILSTKDSIKQCRLLKEIYLDKGTEGLKSIIKKFAIIQKKSLLIG